MVNRNEKRNMVFLDPSNPLLSLKALTRNSSRTLYSEL